jgi:hypothetical protein
VGSPDRCPRSGRSRRLDAIGRSLLHGTAHLAGDCFCILGVSALTSPLATSRSRRPPTARHVFATKGLAGADRRGPDCRRWSRVAIGANPPCLGSTTNAHSGRLVRPVPALPCERRRRGFRCAVGPGTASRLLAGERRASEPVAPQQVFDLQDEQDSHTQEERDSHEQHPPLDPSPETAIDRVRLSCHRHDRSRSRRSRAGWTSRSTA